MIFKRHMWLCWFYGLVCSQLVMLLRLFFFTPRIWIERIWNFLEFSSTRNFQLQKNISETKVSFRGPIKQFEIVNYKSQFLYSLNPKKTKLHFANQKLCTCSNKFSKFSWINEVIQWKIASNYKEIKINWF